MTFELRDCSFSGPALPEPFVKFELEAHLANAKLLRKTSGPEGKALSAEWEVIWRKLRSLGDIGGSSRVANHVIAPLMERLGYSTSRREAEVQTRESIEDGGTVYATADGKSQLRAWALDIGADFDAPSKRGHAYRFSPTRIAQRVLLAKGERLGLLTDGTELRLLLCDPARPESHIAIRLDRAGGWRWMREVPDSYRLVLALACPEGLPKIPELVEQARLTQTRVTAKLREQAKLAVTGFVQELLDDPTNDAVFRTYADRQALARTLWSESLVVIYRLLFILKLESSPDPARAFSFASTSLWRNTYSPNTALARVLDALHKGEETGHMLGDGLRVLFRLFRDGLRSSELKVSPLGGMLFGENATPLLERLVWSERAAARLLDNLLWTPKSGKIERQRVHYGSLDVEDLGRVYEALLELEPGIATEPMCRLRRQKLEVVVPVAQGAPYRASAPVVSAEDETDDADEDEAEDEEEKPARGKATKVQWIEEIKPGRYYLRVGLGRKATGSYYTPHAFVRFLIQETLGPQVAERSPSTDPQPLAILKLKVLDPAMGSGHFLVEACRFLGDKLYEACRLCDELAMTAETQGDAARAAELRQRVADLPDPNDELLAYLPSRVLEGSESGLSQAKAIALCRRLVAVHSLYGVDKNPLAVELAKLSLWLESYAEGLPLTFLDHRLIHGDSLTGPFYEKLGTHPKSGQEVRDLFTQKLTERLGETLAEALVHVRALEATIGKDVADIELKKAAKKRLDEALAPFEVLAAAWSGGVMLGEQASDDDYAALMEVVAAKGDLSAVIAARPVLRKMVEVGKEGVAYDLVFPEVFYPEGKIGQKRGFDVLAGNPPWDKLRVERRDLLASLDARFLSGKESAGSGGEHGDIEASFLEYPEAIHYQNSVRATKAAVLRTLGNDEDTQSVAHGGDPDQYQLFLFRNVDMCARGGQLGLVLGGGLAKNPADAPARRFLFRRFGIRTFVHYLNLRQLFGGASSRIAFVIVSGDRDGRGSFTRLGYELEHFGDILNIASSDKIVLAQADHIEACLHKDANLASLSRSDKLSFGGPNIVESLAGRGIDMSNDLHRTAAKPALKPIGAIIEGCLDAREPDAVKALPNLGYACCYDGRSIDFFNSLPTQKSGKWEPQVLLAADLQHPLTKGLRARIVHYRLAWRSTCGHPATNTRSARACILPPGVLAANSILIESRPENRLTWCALTASSVINSFLVDHQLRPSIQSHLNKGVMALATWSPRLDTASTFLAHASLRLSCINELYAPLWQEQLGDVWREPSSPTKKWPVLASDDARWKVRAAIDAVVADAYGLSREQYAHVLSSFSHKSYPKAPEVCLAAFDELKEKGLEAFTKDNDPYWDVPLNESLPKPVIELPGAGTAGGEKAAQPAVEEVGGFRLTPPEPKKRGRKK